MIEMKNFRVLVQTKNDALLGYTGENLSRRLTIVVDDLGTWAYKLDIRNDAGVANIMDMTAGDGVIYVDIERAALQVSGRVQAQVRAINGDTVKCSNIFSLFIGDSVQAVNYFESLPPSEFEQLEANLTAIKSEAQASARKAKESENNAKAYAEGGTVQKTTYDESGNLAGITATEVTGAKGYQSKAVENAASARKLMFRAKAYAEGGSVEQEPIDNVLYPAVDTIGAKGYMEQAHEAADRAEAAAERAEAVGGSGSGSGEGTPGGYYTPTVSQPDANTMRVSYTPSQEGMPAVGQVDVVLPQGSPGSNGKTAYQYAQDGGYTGSETEFAAKLAAEHLPAPATAAVGQYFKAKTVDENGVVTEVEAVDAPTGGGESSINAEPAIDDIPIVFLSGELPTTKTENTMGFRYISKSKDVSGFVGIKCQGNSSMSYPKKNFTVKMFADAGLSEKMKIDFRGWGEQYKHVYKANWIDLTHARNVVSARLWADIVKSRPDYAQLPELLRDSPNQGAVDGFPIKVYANGVYQGRYTLNIPKDKWCYNMDDTLDTHCILCGENYVSGCFRAAANINGSDWTDELHDTVPASIKTRWNEVISFVQNSTDSEFRENLENYFDVQSLIDYHLFGLASCGLDAYGKNQIYLTYDGTKWIASMYDMDSTWGLWWTGASFVATDYGRSEYQDFKDGEGNLLYIRLESLFYEKLQERWAELRNGALSIENILNRFERFIDIAPSELVKEDYASTTAAGAFTGIPSKTTNNLQQIRAFAVARRAWVDAYVDGLTPTEEVPCTGITLDKTELAFTETGSQTLTATVTPENTTDHVVWESGDVSVATVSDGIVVAVGNGSTTITATCGEYSANCAVSVTGISGGDASDEVDYAIDPLADVTWLENQVYSRDTGVLKETANEYCTTKFRLQGCVYNLTVPGGNHVGLYMWDENGTYVCNHETGANFGNFVANPNWQYAIKFYTVSAFDSSAATLMPVDNTSNAAQTTKLTFNMADLDWSDTSLGTETDITEKFKSAGFTSADSVNKTDGHHVFLFNATSALVFNNAPVFSLFAFGGKYLLSVMDSKADFVKTSGWTLVLN